MSFPYVDNPLIGLHYPMEQQAVWGNPGSPKRLQAIAEQIVRNIRLRSSQGSMRRAVADWTRDLEWLKKHFYPPGGRFRWPDRFA